MSEQQPEQQNDWKADVLLMFSGGLDSTGVFWKLLNNNRKIHVHHMNLRNVERRALAESKSVRDIVNYMSKLGKFAYSESTHQYPVFNRNFIWDSDLTSFMAGNICLACPWIKEVALGLTASDNSAAISQRIERANKMFSLFAPNSVKTYPIRDLTKKQIYEMLPKDLRELTWSCRVPSYSEEGVPSACGKCQTCVEVAQFTI
jgi:7-cyano-7-deazaguanine synthase in queuosine biosynthesis